MKYPLNPSNVPDALVHFLPLAEKWGIGDDIERAHAVLNATREDIDELLAIIGNSDADALFDWLSSDESYSKSPSDEYLALTHLTMACDLARVQRKKNQQAGGVGLRKAHV
jgi:hypothetical protein